MRSMHGVITIGAAVAWAMGSFAMASESSDAPRSPPVPLAGPASAASPLATRVVTSSDFGQDRELLQLSPVDRKLSAIPAPLASQIIATSNSDEELQVMLPFFQGFRFDGTLGFTQSDSCTGGKFCTGGPKCTAFKDCTKLTGCTSGGSCTSGDQCTGGDVCTSGDPGCTQYDFCTGGGNACTGGKTCTAGKGCTGGAHCTDALDCTDAGPCTQDKKHCTTGTSCTKGSGCTKSIPCQQRVPKNSALDDDPAATIVVKLDDSGTSDPNNDGHFAPATSDTSLGWWAAGLLAVPMLGGRRRRHGRA